MRLFIFLSLLFLFFQTGTPASILSAELKLSPEEQAWLATHRSIRISGPRALPPFHYFDDKGALLGMASEYMTYIAEITGLNFEPVLKPTWTQILDGVKNGEIDVLSCTAVSEERKSFLAFSNPLLSFPLIIVSRKDAPFINGPESLHMKKVALVKKTLTVEWLDRKKITYIPYEVDTPLTALKEISMGNADAVIENLAVASYLIEKNGLTNLKIAAPTNLDDYALSIGVRRDWPELVSIFNKVLAAIPREKHYEIRQKWITVRYEHGLKMKDIITWILAVSAFAALIVSIMYWWNRKLVREIQERKKAEEEKEKLIKELRGASEEINTLRGILPICAECKKIRDDSGYWTRLETYLSKHSEADFSHSICPECTEKLYGNEKWYRDHEQWRKKHDQTS